MVFSAQSLRGSRDHMPAGSARRHAGHFKALYRDMAINLRRHTTRPCFGRDENRQLSGSFARALKHRTEIIMVADHPKQGIIAMGSAGENRDTNSAYSGEVYTLYVHPDFQNQGIGETLMAHLFGALGPSRPQFSRHLGPRS